MKYSKTKVIFVFLENPKLPELHCLLVKYLGVYGCLLAHLQPVLKQELAHQLTQ